MEWLFLALAIALEIAGTLSLKVASAGRSLWFVPVTIGYLGSFASLVGALSAGMPLGVAYGIWAATGVALTAVASRFLFQEPLSLLMTAGIGLIAVGVLMVEMGAH